mgnify:CR=1|jgi:hypothetical protein
MKAIKKLDIAIIVLVALLSLLPLAFFWQQEATRVRVTQHGELLYEGPLSQDRLIQAAGCVIAIENGRAFMLEADCPDGLCLRAGAATVNHPVICLPNELVITVSQREEGPDGIAY